MYKAEKMKIHDAQRQNEMGQSNNHNRCMFLHNLFITGVFFAAGYQCNKVVSGNLYACFRILNTVRKLKVVLSLLETAPNRKTRIVLESAVLKCWTPVSYREPQQPAVKLLKLATSSAWSSSAWSSQILSLYSLRICCRKFVQAEVRTTAS